jgi:hypothetical protein
MLNIRLMVTSVLLVAFLAIPPGSGAADKNGKYAVRGVGSSKCGQMVSSIDSKDQNVRKDAVLLYTSWLNGYLSYVDRVEKETYDIIPLADSTHLLAVIVGQCRSHTDTLVESISAQVVGVLSKAKITSESPIVALTVGDQKGSFRKATLIALQNKLIALRHFKGKADGEFGTDSQKALRAFQKAEKLKDTGFPDTDTLMRALLK